MLSYLAVRGDLNHTELEELPLEAVVVGDLVLDVVLTASMTVVVAVIKVGNGILLFKKDLRIPLLLIDIVFLFLILIDPLIDLEVLVLFEFGRMLLIHEQLACDEVPRVEFALVTQCNELAINNFGRQEAVPLLHADEGHGVSVEEGDDLDLFVGALENDALVLVAEVNEALAADLDVACQQQRVRGALLNHSLDLVQSKT